MTMTTIRLINAMLGINNCGSCKGCLRPACGTCLLCNSDKLCLGSVCIRNLTAGQRRLLSLKNDLLRGNKKHRASVVRALKAWDELNLF